MTLSPHMVKYHILTHGDDATLRIYTADSTDSYGDTTYTSADTAITVIRSTMTNTKVPFRRDAGSLGEFVIIDVEFFLLDSVTVPTPRLTGTQRDEIIWRGETYRILEVEDSKLGVQRVLCDRKRG